MTRRERHAVFARPAGDGRAPRRVDLIAGPRRRCPRRARPSGSDGLRSAGGAKGSRVRRSCRRPGRRRIRRETRSRRGPSRCAGGRPEGAARRSWHRASRSRGRATPRRRRKQMGGGVLGVDGSPPTAVTAVMTSETADERSRRYDVRHAYAASKSGAAGLAGPLIISASRKLRGEEVSELTAYTDCDQLQTSGI